MLRPDYIRHTLWNNLRLDSCSCSVSVRSFLSIETKYDSLCKQECFYNSQLGRMAVRRVIFKYFNASPWLAHFHIKCQVSQWYYNLFMLYLKYDWLKMNHPEDCQSTLDRTLNTGPGDERLLGLCYASPCVWTSQGRIGESKLTLNELVTFGRCDLKAAVSSWLEEEEGNVRVQGQDRFVVWTNTVAGGSRPAGCVPWSVPTGPHRGAMRWALTHVNYPFTPRTGPSRFFRTDDTQMFEGFQSSSEGLKVTGIQCCL